MRLLIGFISIALCSAFAAKANDSPPKARPNVLFIAIDDLNHWVGHLGRNKQAITPNIDRLAARGVTFTRAYCAAPVCNPSRAALMSGLRPSTSGVYDNNIDWRPLIAPELTLVTHFRANGYYVAGAGKIYHGAYERRSEWEDYFHSKKEPSKKAASAKDNGVGGIRFAPLDAADEEMADAKSASWGIEQLGRKHEKPFFLAVGFHKPHMPWNVPAKYYAMHPLETIELPPYREDDLTDLPAAGVKMARPDGDHAQMEASGRWKEAIQGYLAAGTFVDVQVGRLIDAFDKSAYRENTIVVLWGDHGWHLGEKHHWRKFALWEEATRAPFIWVVPGLTHAGGRCERTVDFMSVYPTLCELTGLPTPKHVEGVSIKALLADPQADWSRPALTTYGLQNHAVRSEEYRYIRYADGGEELYDERQDPFEWTNLASHSGTDATKRTLAKWFPAINKEPPERAPNRRRARRQNAE